MAITWTDRGRGARRGSALTPATTLGDRRSLAVRKPIASLARSHADPTVHVDWGLLVATVALAAFGLVAIYSARYTAISLAGGDTLYFVKRQSMALALGGAGMVLAMVLDYRRLREWSPLIFGATLA